MWLLLVRRACSEQSNGVTAARFQMTQHSTINALLQDNADEQGSHACIETRVRIRCTHCSAGHSARNGSCRVAMYI